MTAGTNGHKDIFLNDAHRRELRDESAISHDVLSTRGYRTIEKPTSADHRNMDALLKHYPEWAVGKNGNYPGLYIPVFTPTGERVHGQFKPKPGSTGRNGRKYASPTGNGLRLDVHPFNTGKIVDPTEEAWVAEGIKRRTPSRARACALSDFSEACTDSATRSARSGTGKTSSSKAENGPSATTRTHAPNLRCSRP
jgi:hypothetical protein